MLQQSKQPDTVAQVDNTTLKTIEMIQSTSKSLQSLYDAGSNFPLPTTFIFHVITETQKNAFITDAFSFTENLAQISTKSKPFEKHCIDIYSILTTEPHDTNLSHVFHKICELNFADVPFTVVFDPLNNNKTGIFS